MLQLLLMKLLIGKSNVFDMLVSHTLQSVMVL